MAVKSQVPFLHRAIGTVDVIFKYLIFKVNQILSNRTFTFKQVTDLDFVVE